LTSTWSLHNFILAQHSPVLAEMTMDMSCGDTLLPHSVSEVTALIRLMYTGITPCSPPVKTQQASTAAAANRCATGVDDVSLCTLPELANMYQIDGLKRVCERQLVHQLKQCDDRSTLAEMAMMAQRFNTRYLGTRMRVLARRCWVG
jgi:hypothetical protein